MRHFIRILLLLLVLIIDIAAYSQTNPSKSTSSRENADRIENNLHDSVIKVENDSAKISDSISDTTSQNQKLLTQEKTTNWGKRSFWATITDVVFTFLGIIAALLTLWWMIKNSKEEKQQVKQQLTLLEHGNQQAKQQIQNQELALIDSSEKSRKLNASLTESVEKINNYLTQSDLKV